MMCASANGVLRSDNLMSCAVKGSSRMASRGPDLELIKLMRMGSRDGSSR
jgi:hypothetical protein